MPVQLLILWKNNYFIPSSFGNDNCDSGFQQMGLTSDGNRVS